MASVVRQAVVLGCFMLAVIVSIESNSDVTSIKEKEETSRDSTFMEPADAKTFLKPRKKRSVGLLMGLATGLAIAYVLESAEESESESESETAAQRRALRERREENEEESESESESEAAAQRRAWRERREEDEEALEVLSCKRKCWSSWGNWSECDVQCGSSGTRRRYRTVSATYGCSWTISNYGCPGSSSQTQDCGRSCYNGGSLLFAACSCPEGFKGTCCETSVTCGFPGKPANGEVSPTSNSLNHRAIATFSCNDGYDLLGPSNRTCLHPGRWSGTVPECKIRNCGDPGTPANGARVISKLEVHGTAVFSCKQGYRLGSPVSITCQTSGKWSDSIPQCTIVSCGRLDPPAHGGLEMTGTTYLSLATFTCDLGWYMKGSHQRRCLANGRWGGSATSCHLVTCTRLSDPSNGNVAVTSQERRVGTRASYSCLRGFTLHGAATRVCRFVSGSTSQALWTEQQPSCQLVDCGDPGTPEHGQIYGTVFTYGEMVNYTCVPGYVLHGPDSLTCEELGWDKPIPSCSACGLNTFKPETSPASKCSPCPDNSHTASEGSTSLRQCLCDPLYRGPPGGPCHKITCPPIPVGRPYTGVQGVVTDCSNEVGGKCHFQCNPGFFRDHGSGEVTCYAHGQWSPGWPPICLACPEDTYKLKETSCSPCPANSKTNNVGAATVDDCICVDGFENQPDGLCHDIDECLSSNGGCQQTCDNFPGGYACHCISGYKPDGNDASKCILKHSCSELQPPNNGGLVCVLEPYTGTTRCSVKCNPGYEFPVRTNLYDECGPSTNWMWSHEEGGLSSPEYLPCVVEYFPAVTLEAEVAYFVESCDEFDEEGITKVQNEFLQLMKDSGICLHEGKYACLVEDVQVNCSEAEWQTGERWRRDVEQPMAEVKIKFVLKSKEETKNDSKCSLQCQNVVVLKKLCMEDCLDNFKQRRESALDAKGLDLGGLFNQSDVLGNSSFLPTRSLRYKQLTTSRVTCEGQMVLHDDFCVPCPAGSFLDGDEMECTVRPSKRPRPLNPVQYGYGLPPLRPESNFFPTLESSGESSGSGDERLVVSEEESLFDREMNDAQQSSGDVDNRWLISRSSTNDPWSRMETRKEARNSVGSDSKGSALNDGDYSGEEDGDPEQFVSADVFGQELHLYNKPGRN